jgi:hypothetical protein
MQVPMTTEQREYTIRRLDEITREKIAAKTKELFGEGGPQQPTWGMVFEGIASGEITRCRVASDGRKEARVGRLPRGTSCETQCGARRTHAGRG